MSREKETYQGFNNKYAKELEDILRKLPDDTSFSSGLKDDKDDIRQGRLSRRKLFSLGAALGALSGIGLTTLYGTTENQSYSFHLDGIPPAFYFTQSIIVDFQNVPILDTTGRHIPLSQIDTVNGFGLLPDFPYSISKPLIAVNPLNPDEMMVKLNLTFLNNPRKHTTGYIPYKNLEEWNDDALYNESFFQSVSVNSVGG